MSIFGIVGLVFWLSILGFSQGQSRYCMTVRDDVGGAIPKATVIFSPTKRSSSRTKYELVADDEGSIDKTLVDGIYDITVKAEGFKKTILKNQLLPHDASCITITLKSAVPPHQITDD